MDETSVLIVGAGPTGLSLALECARFGVAFRIVDARREPAGGSRALTLHARTLELLEASHLTEKLLPFAHRVLGARTVSADGTTSDVSYTELPTDYPFAAIVPQDAVERAMIVRLLELGHTVERGKQLTGLVELRDALQAVLEGDGRSETLRAAFVAGCDGPDSTVRTLLDTSLAGDNATERYATVDVCLCDTLPDDRIVSASGADGTHVAAIPMPDGLWRLTFGPVALSAPAGMSDLARPLAVLGPAARVASIAWSGLYDVRRQRVARYRTGRAFLLGDAAHAQSALGGRGLDTAIGDAVNLAWKLAAAQTFGAPDVVLDSYHDEREPVARALRADGAASAAEQSGLAIDYAGSGLSRNAGPLPGTLRAGMRVRGHRPAGVVPQTVVAPPVDGHDAMTVVVRPDGYAGFVAAGAQPDAATRYLTEVFGLAPAPTR